MDKIKLLHTCEYFLHMVRLGIRENLTEDDKLPEKPEDVEWKTLFRLSELHSLAAVTFRALQHSGLHPDEETFAAWKNLLKSACLQILSNFLPGRNSKSFVPKRGFVFCR